MIDDRHLLDGTTHHTCSHRLSVGLSVLVVLDSRFAHACPDLDQGMPETETFDAWMTRTGGRADVPRLVKPDMVNHPPHYKVANE